MDFTGQLIEDLLASTRRDAELVRNGARAVELRVHPALRNLNVCYRKALKDDNTKIPTYLHAALEAAARLVKEPS